MITHTRGGGGGGKPNLKTTQCSLLLTCPRCVPLCIVYRTECIHLIKIIYQGDNPARDNHSPPQELIDSEGSLSHNSTVLLHCHINCVVIDFRLIALVASRQSCE